MGKPPTVRFVPITVGGEAVAAFVPGPLPRGIVMGRTTLFEPYRFIALPADLSRLRSAQSCPYRDGGSACFSYRSSADDRVGWRSARGLAGARLHSYNAIEPLSRDG